MDALLNQLENLVGTASFQARQSIIGKLRDLANSLETPDNTLDRIAFGVSLGKSQ